MPAQQGIGLDDHQSGFPHWQSAGHEDKQCAVTLGLCGAFHLPMQHDGLLTEERVFKHQIRLAARPIQDCIQSRSLVVRLRPMTKTMLDIVAQRI